MSWVQWQKLSACKCNAFGCAAKAFVCSKHNCNCISPPRFLMSPWAFILHQDSRPVDNLLSICKLNRGVTCTVAICM